MSTIKNKDIGLMLDTDSHFSIINYKQTTLHPILQAAITLLFLTNDESLRGEYAGIYNFIGNTTNDIKDDIELELASIGFALTPLLKEQYPEVLKTDFEVNLSNYNLEIILNISTTDDVLSTAIYSRKI